jgi:hypothetical protein
MTLVLIDPPSPFEPLATWRRHLDECRRLPDDTLLKAELIKTAKEAIESRTNRSYLPDTRAGGLQCRSSLHGMITVAIDGESIFTWDGDEAAVKHVLEDFPHGAASAGMTPRALADNCVAHYRRVCAWATKSRAKSARKCR